MTRRELTANERHVLEVLGSTPRVIACSFCLVQTQHDVAEVELGDAADSGLVRWWSCSVCGQRRALDSIAAARPAVTR